ncbi:MAG: ribbon-helix-helix domain-containing protein [Chthoniobacterales bacterium]
MTFVICKISSYSMRSTLTVSLPAKLRREMERAAASEHRNASEFVRDAIRTKLWQKSLDDSRDVLVPAARARGIYTDEDVFRAVS